MQALLFFLNKYGNILLFLILQTICLVLLIQFNPTRKSIFLKSSGGITAFVNSKFNGLTQYIGLPKALEAAQRSTAEELITHPAFQFERLNGQAHYRDSLIGQQYALSPAKIVSNSVVKLDNYFTLNKGSEDNVVKDMGVVYNGSPIGVIIDTSPKYARAMSILNRNMRLSVVLEESNYFGILRWDGLDVRLAKLDNVPKHATISEGARIYTSGYSHIFPSGLFIGSIKRFRIKEGTNFYDITVELASDMANLRYGLVVTNFYKEELRLLESTE